MHFYQGDVVNDGKTVFVFGSNPEGRHGAGAAKVARLQFGAVYGRGEGLQGMSYAIPTKDLRITAGNGYRSIKPEAIKASIQRMYRAAAEHPELAFKVAYRNTFRRSLNGYTGFEMIRMFIDAGPIPQNVWFSREWGNTGMFRK